MKRLSLLLIALVGAIAANAQVHVNANVAGQFEPELGMRAGAEIEIPVRNKISIIPGVYWSQRRFSETVTSKQTTTTYHDHADFLTAPVLLGVRLGREGRTVEPRILVGPYVAYGMGGTTSWTRDEDGTVTEGSVSAFDSGGGWDKRFDAGLHAGFDLYIARHLVVGAYAEFGFVRGHHMHSTAGEVVSQIFLGVGNRNHSFGLSVGYRF